MSDFNISNSFEEVSLPKKSNTSISLRRGNSAVCDEFKLDKNIQTGNSFVNKEFEYEDIPPINSEYPADAPSFDISGIIDQEIRVNDPAIEVRDTVNEMLQSRISELENFVISLKNSLNEQNKIIDLQEKQLKTLKETLIESENKFNKNFFTDREGRNVVNMEHLREVLIRLFKQLPKL